MSKVIHRRVANPPGVGAEVVTGSSRVSRHGASVAHALRRLMIKSGKVFSNLMVDVVPPSNCICARSISVKTLPDVPANKRKQR